MKQRFTIRRVETRIVEIDAIQPLTRQSLTTLVNDPSIGLKFGATLSSMVTEFEVTAVTPSCECQTPTSATRKRRTR